MSGERQVIYQSADGAIELPLDATTETIWATQKQIAGIFGVTPQNITIHLKSVYSDGEMDEQSTCKESLQVQTEGGREVERRVKLYNLDAIIAVGYRVGSRKGTEFRKWATKTLRRYMTDGFVINPERIKHNYSQFELALGSLKALANKTPQVGVDSAINLTKEFASTWLSLDAYDRASLPEHGSSKRQVDIGADDLVSALADLRTQLIKGGEATDIFGQERVENGLRALFGNVFQSFNVQLKKTS